MSQTSDAVNKLILNQAFRGYKMKPESADQKTVLDKVSNFTQTIPYQLNYGSFPKTNPYGSMSSEDFVADKEPEIKLPEPEEADNETYEDKVRRVSLERAFETERQIKLAYELERMKNQQLVESRKQLMPLETQQTVEQLRTALPIIDEAAERATLRNLAASERFLAFKERQPSMKQRIAESQQAQMLSASQAFGEEARAIAAQLDAATRFGEIGSSPRASIYQGLKQS